MKELNAIQMNAINGAGGYVYGKVTKDGWEIGFKYEF